ncbi:tRNA lysidine(34) synthetase TilS [Capnocytophaga genosp. AHN8471]|uniref:tRNA lysidine(34) synthetase TilS n=1 Tax=Capnocytophaga genosp. AHN8471 TaxID=327574 RepID=UPI001931F0E6|nr:tRNA lysidine(34) synthetase TilS [Capnocytophaga genosp. AHN8471]MBM0656892.1 tRNA lysidine(34) synthetase TilS [Capnocytophaga genosp. AHN8471]
MNTLNQLKNKKILLAISGGIDSVVLTHLLHSHGTELLLAHCNFQLREEESDGDEAFVHDFAKTLGIPLEVKRFDTHQYAIAHQLNTQLAARELRYEWFYELLETHHCDALATAHHANDNLETFLINLSRGSGLDGLLGIPQQIDKIVRPLLQWSRQQIYDYAEAHRLQWREDSSNSSNKYVRNVIRHEIIPQMAAVHPNYLENFNQTQEYLHQSARFIDFYIEEWRKSCFSPRPQEGGLSVPIAIDTEKLQTAPEIDLVLHKLFYPYGFGNVKDLKNLLFNAEAGKQLLSATHSLVKDSKGAWLKELTAESLPPTLTYEELSPPFHITKGDPNIAFIDADKLTAPLTLRQKQTGDFFYPIGLGVKKKLSKFFIDEKYSQVARENQWLLCSGEDIVWVIGKRLDDRFKITENTQRILKVVVS